MVNTPKNGCSGRHTPHARQSPRTNAYNRMLEDGMVNMPRLTWDGRINLSSILALFQLVALLGGGFYFVGQFQQELASVMQRMDRIESTVLSMSRSMDGNNNRTNERIDRLRDAK